MPRARSDVTTENREYGGGWEECARCGCRDRVGELQALVGGGFIHPAERSERCERWKKERESAKERR